MAQPAQSYDIDPQHYRGLTTDERRIADAVAKAVVGALSPTLDSMDKRLGSLEIQMDGVHKIFAANNFIIPSHDD